MKTVANVLVILLVAVVIGIVMLPFNFVIMWLWNWLMPAIFNLPTLTFWQSYGLLWLIRLLTPAQINAKTKD